jgi:predicted Zn finger-like uncharacterized protein
MLVRCPKCRTTYKVSDDLLKGSSTAFRCSRCKHTFELESLNPELLPDAQPEGTAAAAPQFDPEPRLPFEPKQADCEAVVDADAVTPSAAAPAERPTALESNAQWSLHDARRDDEHQFVLPDSPRPIAAPKAVDGSQDFPADDPFFSNVQSADEFDESNNILAIATYREQNASILPFVTLFGLLVISFSLISVFSYAKPQASERIIKSIPVIGNSVLRNDYLKDGILIQSLRAGFQTIQGNREVLLVSGVAVNQNPVVVGEVKLSGIAYNDMGKELEKQTIWVGNTISPKIIRGMTLEDIPHLQNLKPLKSFEIPPGDSIAFTIVFLKSAKSAKEFSCDVLAAQAAT